MVNFYYTSIIPFMFLLMYNFYLADNLNVKKSSASTNINLMKTKKDKKKIKDHKRSGNKLLFKWLYI